jgi:TRAP-type C4-dicarboxylate transport system permease small subunit
MPFSLLLLLIFIVLSWLSIRLPEKRNIFQSWLTPANQRFKEFLIGFLLMGTLCILSQIVLSQISGTRWTVSEEITISKFLYAAAFDVNSVLCE